MHFVRFVEGKWKQLMVYVAVRHIMDTKVIKHPIDVQCVMVRVK